MAEKGFGVKEIKFVGSTPKIDSPNNINLNAVNVAISTNVSIGGTLTVTGNVSVGGTLTYEDVTNIDSVGLITARNGLNVTAGVSTFADEIHGNNQRLGSLSSSGRFNGLFLNDGNSYYGNSKLFVASSTGFGLEAYGGMDSYLKANSGGGTSGNCYMRTGSSSGGYVFVNGDNGVEIHHAGTSNKKFETTSSGATVTGTLTATTFSGSGASLTNLPVADSDIQVVYTVTANGTSAYRFAGNGVVSTADDPDLYLIRGQKYRFINNSGGSHPFQIRESSGGTAYSTGVTNNGAASGNIDFAPTYDSPAQLVYQCTSHGGMVGNIYLRDAAGNNTNVGVTTFSGNVTTTQFKVTTGANAFETSANVFKGASGQKGVYLRSALSSATTPSYSSVDDTNTGIFLPGSDVFAVTTGGTERLRITSDGDFGTNGVTPTTQSGRVFHLHAGAAQQRFHMTNNTTGVSATDGFEILIDTETNANCRIRNFEAGYMAFDTGGSNNEVMRLDSSGNVIIGSTSAEAKLDVTGGVSISSNGVTVSPSGYDLKIRSNTGKLGIHIDNASGTPTLEFGTGNATTGGAITTNSHGIFLKPGGADKLKVEPDGIRSFATVVDTSYHANPDPFADGSGLVYYRMNYNFQDSGLYGFHGTGSQGSPNKEFNASPHFSLVNSSGEPCWDNPNEGAIDIPNLKNSYPFSMAAWINVSSWPTTADNDLIMNLSIANQRVSLSICCFGTAVSDGADFYIMYGGTGHHYFRPSSKPTNEWIHVVYSVVGSNDTDHRVYQNGADLTTRGNRGGGHGGSAGWALGGNASNSERFSIGRIGSIRFFNKALSSSEASALYTNDTFYT